MDALYGIYQWLCFTRTGMIVLCVSCFVIFLLIAFLLELRTRKRFYNHEKKQRKSAAYKAGEKIAEANEATQTFRERMESGEGLFGGEGILGDAEIEDDDDEEDGMGSFFAEIRKDLDDWDPDEDEDEDKGNGEGEGR